MLTEQPLPRGRRLGIVSNAGGIGILAADGAETNGLVVPELSTRVRRASSATSPGPRAPATRSTSAPARSRSDLAAAMEEVLACGEVDALIVVVVATRSAIRRAMLRVDDASPGGPPGHARSCWSRWVG